MMIERLPYCSGNMVLRDGDLDWHLRPGHTRFGAKRDLLLLPGNDNPIFGTGHRRKFSSLQFLEIRFQTVQFSTPPPSHLPPRGNSRGFFRGCKTLPWISSTTHFMSRAPFLRNPARAATTLLMLNILWCSLPIERQDLQLPMHRNGGR